LFERLKSALERHKHITFTGWSTQQKNKNSPDPRVKGSAISTFISQAPDHDPTVLPEPPFLQIVILVKDTGHVQYTIMACVLEKDRVTHMDLNTRGFDVIDPIRSPADAVGFVSHVLNEIRTHIGDLPAANGYFI
jgi:hypothetical protein